MNNFKTIAPAPGDPFCGRPVPRLKGEFDRNSVVQLRAEDCSLSGLTVDGGEHNFEAPCTPGKTSNSAPRQKEGLGLTIE
jgi:hypothetical protein